MTCVIQIAFCCNSIARPDVLCSCLFPPVLTSPSLAKCVCRIKAVRLQKIKRVKATGTVWLAASVEVPSYPGADPGVESPCLLSGHILSTFSRFWLIFPTTLYSSQFFLSCLPSVGQDPSLVLSGANIAERRMRTPGRCRAWVWSLGWSAWFLSPQAQ